MNNDKGYTITIITIGLLFVISIGIHLNIYGNSEPAIRIIIAATARIAAVLFSLAFSASALHHFFRNAWTGFILQHRAHIGLSFFIAHSVHLISLIYLQAFIHPVFTLARTSSLLGGGFAYAFIIIMATTTFEKPKKWLSPARWRILHLIGSYWIWIIFFRSYFRKIFLQNEGQIIFTILTIAIILRFLKWIMLRKVRFTRI